MKRVVLIPIEPEKNGNERRRNQRRNSVPRRLGSVRRSGASKPRENQRMAIERRDSGDRRRLPDRRLGLTLDLDWSELE